MPRTRRCWVAASGIASLAFPAISTGVYSYPLELAAKGAVQTVRTTVEGLPAVTEVVFCCFSPGDLRVYLELLKE